MLLFQLLVGEVWLKISLWSLELDSFFVVVVFIFGKTSNSTHLLYMQQIFHAVSRNELI